MVLKGIAPECVTQSKHENDKQKDELKATIFNLRKFQICLLRAGKSNLRVVGHRI